MVSIQFIQEASKDPARAARLVDVCRMQLGMSYMAIYELVRERTGLSLPAWDELLQESEDL